MKEKKRTLSTTNLPNKNETLRFDKCDSVKYMKIKYTPWRKGFATFLIEGIIIVKVYLRFSASQN